jgi:hypothetical protein
LVTGTATLSPLSGGRPVRAMLVVAREPRNSHSNTITVTVTVHKK